MSSFRDLLNNKGRTPEEIAKYEELIKAVNEDAQKNWEDPAWRREMARVLTISILEGFRFETFYDRVVDVERVGFDDKVQIREETGLKVFFIAKGGHIEASALVSEIFELPRDTLGFHVYEFEDKMQAGFAKTAAELRNLAVQRLDWGVANQIKALVEATIDVSSPYYESGAGLSQATLNTAITEVRDESMTGSVTLYGRATMVEQISDFTGYADEAREEIRRRGLIGVYKGANVVVAKNWKDEDGASYIPANELYVISNDAGKFGIYGGLKTKEYVELDNWYWHYLGRQDFGGAFHRPERIRRIVDTSITP